MVLISLQPYLLTSLGSPAGQKLSSEFALVNKGLTSAGMVSQLIR